MKFSIRDDDTSFFTNPQVLHNIYGEVAQSVPVCLACVPFHGVLSRPGIPSTDLGTRLTYDINENAELISYLRESLKLGRFTIALHGYTHLDSDNRTPEFCGDYDHFHLLQMGRHHLEASLNCTIQLFVPPHNALNKQSLAALSRSSLSLLGSYNSFMNRVPDRYFLRNIIISYYDRLRCFVSPYALITPYASNQHYTRHNEHPCVPLIPGITFTQLINTYYYLRRISKNFILATHYWELYENPDMLNVLYQFVQFMLNQPDVLPCSCEEIVYESDI